MKGSDGSIFAVGDCTASQYAPTAQVASQQGAYLARVLKQMSRRDALSDEIASLKKEQMSLRPDTSAEDIEELKKKVEKAERQLEKASKIRPFHYSHQGSLA